MYYSMLFTDSQPHTNEMFIFNPIATLDTDFTLLWAKNISLTGKFLDA